MKKIKAFFINRILPFIKNEVEIDIDAEFINGFVNIYVVITVMDNELFRTHKSISLPKNKQ